MQAVRGERIRQRARNVQFETVTEHVQADAGTGQRIIAVGRGVHDRLEDGPLAELRAFLPDRGLRRPDQHVPPHEVERLGNLLVERPSDVARVGLIVGVGPLTGVAHSLNVGVRKPALGVLRTQQHTGERQPGVFVRVVGDDTELAERVLGRFGGIRIAVSTPPSRKRRVSEECRSDIVVAGTTDSSKWTTRV